MGKTTEQFRVFQGDGNGGFGLTKTGRNAIGGGMLVAVLLGGGGSGAALQYWNKFSWAVEYGSMANDRSIENEQKINDLLRITDRISTLDERSRANQSKVNQLLIDVAEIKVLLRQRAEVAGSDE